VYVGVLVCLVASSLVCLCGHLDLCMRSNCGQEGDWSSGMIPALGAGGREFDSRITPFLFAYFPLPAFDSLRAQGLSTTCKSEKGEKK
jgi:hypothetical protein